MAPLETSDIVKSLTAIALLPLFLAFPVPAFSQDSGQACATIADNSQRLICYDQLFRGLRDPADAISIVFSSEQLIPARPNGRGLATMTVSCEAGTLSVAFAFAGHKLSATGRDSGITLQSDLQTARTLILPVAADNLSLVMDTTATAAAFLDTLEGTTNLLVRTTPFSYRSLSVRFRVDGAEAAVAPIRSACE